MATHLLIILLLTLKPSSFTQITSEEINNYKVGLDIVISETQNHTFQEKNFDTNLTAEIVAEQYDFIIIGAGAAGSVIANRLSANHDYSILLLEAGGRETEYTQTPALAPVLLHTDYNWGYLTTPQNNTCGAMVNNQCYMAAGKALGGGTAINEMYCTRGSPEDYNRWARMGNSGWSYRDVLPYFKKLEDADIKPFDMRYRSRLGPFHIEYPRYHTNITNISLTAGEELGLQVVDYNAGEELGIGLSQLSTKSGTRYSTGQAYLKSAEKRSNLVIQPFSQVTKILINSQKMEATGVEFLKQNKLFRVNAEKEVILSAGAINSAQILMLSGIGPREDLKKLNITVVADLNVGKHLKNHVRFLPITLISNQTQPVKNETKDIIQYLQKGRGPLTVPGIETLSFIQTGLSIQESDYPDIEIWFRGSSNAANYSRLKPQILETLSKPTANKTTLNIGVTLLHPASTGTVVLKDKDPLHPPLIDPNLLSDPQDLPVLLAGIRAAFSFTATDVFKKLNWTLDNQKVPGCENCEYGSDDYWRCAIRLLAVNAHDVTGTAKMGPEYDTEAVVDNQLRVYGVSRLRVADSSVIPVTISGHTMLPSIMIGEKASDLIKETWY